MSSTIHKHLLIFKNPSGTSRGILLKKKSYFIKKGNAIGECSLIKGLSPDNLDFLEEKLDWVTKNINLPWEIFQEELRDFPAMLFAVEQYLLSDKSKIPLILYPSEFTYNNDKGILTNGLIWMGNEQYMTSQIQQKIREKYNCIKLKIGALDFEKELKLIHFIREQYPKIEIRLDVNGGFSFKDALSKLQQLSAYNIHSVEQPIKPNQYQEMAMICEKSPIPIALDEELINVQNKISLLETIKPQYLILKPSLLGGFSASQQWIDLAKRYNIKWWITSALESNIGLNAIAQWTYTLNNSMPQGLGTGELFINNIESPLYLKEGKLYYNSQTNWKLNDIF